MIVALLQKYPSEAAMFATSFLVVGYLCATCGLASNVAGPIFISRKILISDARRAVIHSMFLCFVVVGLPVLIYSYFILHLPPVFIFLIFSIGISFVICPFWMPVAGKLPDLYAGLALFRSASLLAAVAISLASEMDFEQPIYIFAAMNLVASITASVIKNRILVYNFKRRVLMVRSYYRFSRPLVLTMQLNLFVSYIVPLASNSFLNSEEILKFYMLDRLRYMILALLYPIFMNFQRQASIVQFRSESIKNARKFTIVFSVIIFLLYMIYIFNIIKNELYDESIIILILLASATTTASIYSNFLSTCVLLSKGSFKVHAKANVVSMCAYTTVLIITVPSYGAAGLFLSSFVLECVLIFSIKGALRRQGSLDAST